MKAVHQATPPRHATPCHSPTPRTYTEQTRRPQHSLLRPREEGVCGRWKGDDNDLLARYAPYPNRTNQTVGPFVYMRLVKRIEDRGPRLKALTDLVLPSLRAGAPSGAPRTLSGSSLEGRKPVRRSFSTPRLRDNNAPLGGGMGLPHHQWAHGAGCLVGFGNP